MNPPFLPEPEVVTPAGAKNRGIKTLVLWVVLIVMFLAIWQFLTPAERKVPRNTTERVIEACQEASSAWSSTAVMLVPLLFVVLFLFFLVRLYRQNARFNVAIEPGRIALSQARFGEAVSLFRASVATVSKQPAYRCSALLHVAEAEMQAGRLDEALATYAEIERAKLLLLGSTQRVRLAVQTAFVLALKGDVPLAERWIDASRVRLAKTIDDRLGSAALLALAEATLLCRKGAYDDAVKHLDSRWREMRLGLSAHTFRFVEILRAFAEAQGGVRSANTVAERFVRVEPVVKGELAFLGVAWPEMQAFLAAHDL